MIESDIVTKEQDIKYPKLMVSGDLIVFFRKSGEVVLFREVDGRVFSGHEKTEIVCVTLYLDDARTNVIRHTFFFHSRDTP